MSSVQNNGSLFFTVYFSQYLLGLTHCMLGLNQSILIEMDLQFFLSNLVNKTNMKK